MLTSPNPIPPRTSSSGLHSHSNSIPSSAQPSSPPPPPAATRPVLKPVSEGDWLAQKAAAASNDSGRHHRHHSSSFGTVPPPLPAMYHPTPSSAVAPHTTTTAGSLPPPPPPPDPNRFAHDDFDFGPTRSWTADKESKIRGPYDYVISHPGKDFRAQLIAAFNAWLNVPPRSLDIITRVVGMLHEASLLVDDVQDNSQLRRGYPVAHAIFGVPQTINSANYIYFAALRDLVQLDSPDAVSTFAEELINLHRGQGMDLYWRDNLVCPSEDDYLEMVGNKTGGLFRLGIKLMQAVSPEPIDCVPLVNLIGLIFQIRDDYINLSSAEYSSNKGMCEDLTEGKFSFPILHSIRADPNNRQLINILKQKTSNVQIKEFAVRYMESTGSFEYTRQVLAVLVERARRTAEKIDAGRGKLAGIYKILDRMAVE
ncbi:Geranylgeranyl pyrophosphate synthase-like protein [Hapsidospora chrysogenum ATCC 11550]|uniref:Geranylgeranyl pyrophosphate synthase-like protein n=1 Tax=Hapsidospora chrysogenum (strain ATCC 11550 / CBS 779.69 / DSM 880 / IAM 14645 / JCM 23072 / IMI 49137) TaxID=857340 RepID=A0A086SWS2_HAPC1|nr:Geranylgeranyl pyrophosphate synthase-like protein [Hapsidospora chrysogenum ATCC 11550]